MLLFQNSILKFCIGVKILNKILINEVLHKVELAYWSGLFHYIAGFFIKGIPVAGERCNITGQYFERGSAIVIDYQTFDGEFCLVNGEFSDS